MKMQDTESAEETLCPMGAEIHGVFSGFFSVYLCAYSV
jgi:hypothetical protein